MADQDWAVAVAERARADGIPWTAFLEPKEKGGMVSSRHDAADAFYLRYDYARCQGCLPPGGITLPDPPLIGTARRHGNFARLAAQHPGAGLVWKD
jgi:hypothetical protein